LFAASHVSLAEKSGRLDRLVIEDAKLQQCDAMTVMRGCYGGSGAGMG
jgi:hypothetical protein